MDLGKLYEYFLYVLNEDSLGIPSSPRDFNSMIQIAAPNFTKDEYKTYVELLQANGIDAAVRYLNESPFARHITTKEYYLPEEEIELAPIPEDLYQVISGEARYNDVWRGCELFDNMSFDKIRHNMFGRNVKRKPIFTKKTDGFMFVPRNTRRARITYIKQVPKPVFDFCIGVDDMEVYYMFPGWFINISSESGQDFRYDLYNENNDVIATNVTHSEISTENVPYNSKSVELDWDEDTQTKIIDKVISTGGVRNREINLKEAQQ